MKQNNRDEMNINRLGKKTNLTMGMVRLLILCLLIPFFMLSVVLFYFSETKTSSQVEDAVATSIENAAEGCDNNIDKIIENSKQASYDGVIRNSYLKYKEDKNEADMYNEISVYLNDTYKFSSFISSTILLFHENTTMEYYTFSNKAGATYSTVYDFKINAMEKIKKEAEELGTDSKFVMVGKHLYLIRNLVTSSYEPFATLVMEINIKNTFKTMDSVVWMEEALAYIDGKEVKGLYDEETDNIKKIQSYVKENYILNHIDGTYNTKYDKKNAFVYFTENKNNQQFTYVIKLDKIGILNQNSTLGYVYIIIFILALFQVALTFWYFYKNINKPITQLMIMSEKIEEGEYGIELPAFNSNEEFGKLYDTFNHMSTSLKESFNRIYAEEVALRDANIQALQAQINPHFLNNTLEIINWKARMSGNTDVSEMIESLGIMMEATMNREKKAFIPIREEMRYVDAYLYIIRQRFGSKFRFQKEIDEGLMDIKIPRLIIQPIVENMVEHGGDKYGNKTGWLKIYMDYKYLHIVVENNGNISEDEQKKIDMLLNAVKLEENVHNIGIRNVNLRLKLTYGDDSGLTITNKEKSVTISEIKISRLGLAKHKEQ